MHSNEIYTRLNTIASNQTTDLLRQLDQDHEFWPCIYYALAPEFKYPVAFKLIDPPSFGKGVPAGVIIKIITGMIDETLNASQTIEAISLFSRACTQKQWTQFYSLVLARSMKMPKWIHEFNRHAPDRYQIELFRLPPFQSLTDSTMFPKRFVVEPYPSRGKRYLVLLDPDDSATVFNEKGDETVNSLSKLFSDAAIDDPVLIECVLENQTVVLRDILRLDQYYRNKPCPPLRKRLSILADFHQAYFETNPSGFVVDSYMADLSDSKLARSTISIILQQGYDRFVFRGQDSLYSQTGGIMVHPNTKSVLTIVGVDGTDEVEYLHGRGRLGGKEFETPVFHGLISSQRKQLYSQKADLIGKKFEVVSCGLGQDGKLMFPIFRRFK